MVGGSGFPGGPAGGARGIAVVTGASSGIGAATSRALGAAGFSVVAAARRADRLAEVAAQTGGRAVVLDVTDAASVESLRAGVDDVALLVTARVVRSAWTRLRSPMPASGPGCTTSTFSAPSG